MIAIQYPRIYSALLNTVWLSMPSVPESIFKALADHQGVVFDPSVKPAALSMSSQGVSRAYDPFFVKSSYVIPVQGILGKHLSGLETMCGGYEISAIAQHLDRVANDPQVKSVVLWFDCPGGSAVGVAEAADQIKAFEKPIYAYTDAVMASAAYWLASATDGIAASGSAYVGSIGAYMALLDTTKENANQGRQSVVIASGDMKATGYPGTSLSEEELAFLQDRVDQQGAQFRQFVKDNRSDSTVAIEDSVLRGQVFLGSTAIGNGLIDDIVPSLELFAAALHESL